MKEALRLRPDDANCYHVLAGALGFLGRTDEAAAAQARCDELRRRPR